MVTARDYIQELKTRKILSDKHIAIIEQSLLQPADEIPAGDLANYLVEQLIISAPVSNAILNYLNDAKKASPKPVKKEGSELRLVDDSVVNLVPTSRPGSDAESRVSDSPVEVPPGTDAASKTPRPVQVPKSKEVPVPPKSPAANAPQSTGTKPPQPARPPQKPKPVPKPPKAETPQSPGNRDALPPQGRPVTPPPSRSERPPQSPPEMPPGKPPETPGPSFDDFGDDEKRDFDTPLSLKDASWRIREKKRESQWDTPLVKYGIISLGLLILASVVLVWLLMQRRADEVLAAADEAYDNGAYAQAIEGYNDFIASFENNANVPKAKLRVALSKIRLITESKSNWDKALACVREELPDMSQLPDFAGEGRIELSAILPNVAEGLAAMADKSNDVDSIRQSEAALALVDEHVPNAMQPFNQLQATRRSLELTQRRIARDEEIVTVKSEITAMLDAIRAGTSDDIATLRRQLADAFAALARYLHSHPEMRGNPVVEGIKNDIARTEALCQKWIPHTAENPVDSDNATVSPAVAPMPALLLTYRNGPAIDAADAALSAQPFVSYAGQNVYAINPATGAILWRCPVGLLGLEQNSPLLIPGLPGGNTLLADSRVRSLLMVDTATGKERFRLPLGETAYVNPQPMWPVNFVTTPTGKLMLVDLAKGQRLGHIDLMQNASAPPCYDLERQLVVQPALHSALHVFRYEPGANVPLTNVGIVPTGHLESTIYAAPVIHKGFLLVAEQTGPMRTTIKLFAPANTDRPVPWVDEPLQIIPFDGLVKSSPLVNGNDLLYMAERGDVKLISLTGTDPAKPYQVVAEGRIDDPLKRGETVSGRFASLAGRSLWVADNRLQHFEVQPSRSRLIPQDAPSTPAMISQSPLEIADNHLLQTYLDPLMGVAVARSFALSNLATRWQTEFGEAVSARPVVTTNAAAANAPSGSGVLHLVTLTGKLFDIPLDELTAQREATLCNTESYMRQRVAPGTLTEPVTDLVPLDDGLDVLCCISPNVQMTNLPTSSAIRVYDGKSPQSQVRTYQVPAPLTGPVVPLGQGIVAPLSNGQLAFYSPADGSVIGNPFVTKRTQDAPSKWSPLTLISKKTLDQPAQTETQPATDGANAGTALDATGDAALLVGDAAGLLQQIELVTQNNRPALVMTKSLQLPVPIVAKPLVCGRNIVIADNAGHLVLFEYDQLTAEGNTLQWPTAQPEPPSPENSTAGSGLSSAQSPGQPPAPESPNKPAAVNQQYGGVIVTGNVEPQNDSPFVINARPPRAGAATETPETTPGKTDQPAAGQTASSDPQIDAPYQAWELDGEVVWGPFPCGHDAAVAVTDRNVFVAVTQADQPINSRKAAIRELPLEHGPPVGQPFAISETQLLFATRKGSLLRFDLPQGTLAPVIETGVAPGCGPVVANSKIILIGTDGAIYTF